MSSNYKKYVRDEFSGKGTITFQDGINYTANFQLYLYNSGSIVGSMWFTTVDSRLNEEVNRNETFTIGGEVQNGLTISAGGCAFYSFTPIEVNNFPLSTARFIVSRLKVYDDRKLKNLDEEKAMLCFEFGILNYYSTTKFLLKTEIGEIQSVNILSDEEIAIFRNSFIPFISTCFQVKIKGQRSLEDVKQTIFNVVRKILELTSFALTTEHRWSYYKIYLEDFSGPQFAYSECINQLPRLPNSHNNISDSRIQDFLNLSYCNYTDELNKKYNFSLALGWYLDSLSLRYDVMQYISASTAFESILEVFSTDSGLILSKKDFDELSKKIKTTIKNELEEKISQEDMDSMVKSLPNINRRHYRTKAEGLLESLGILDDETKNSLNDIIQVRNQITHTGRSKDLDKEKVTQTYLKFLSLLTKIFFKILVPDEHVFAQEFHNMTWKILR